MSCQIRFQIADTTGDSWRGAPTATVPIVQRSFFGSNWPVDRPYGSYGDVVDAYDEITSDFTSDERTALFSANAERILRV